MKKSFDGTRIQVDLCWIGAPAGLLFISGATISNVFLKGSCYELSVGYRISRQSVSFSFLLLFILFLVIIITSFILFLVIQNSLHFTFRRDVWPTHQLLMMGLVDYSVVLVFVMMLQRNNGEKRVVSY